MHKFISIIFLLFSFSTVVLAQSGVIQGRVFDPINNEGIAFANVIIQGTTTGATTDIDGYYKIEKLEPALYNIEVSYIGFDTQVVFEIQVSNSRPANVDIEMLENSAQLEEVVIKAKAFSKTEESPVSLRSIGVDEIRRNPGGNRDVSKAIQSLPGVASTANFRNDILIRGGSPSENSFYIDGIEIPVINHFATQGGSGGPNGLINVDFVKEVDFYSGAFPANRGNAMSSVFDFKFIEGNPDKLLARFTLGSSDAGLTLEGPLGKKTNFIISTRRSYLQFLFDALGLPFLPTYTDYQVKVKHKFNEKNHLTAFQIGAFDDFVLNLDENETEEQRYFLNNIPITEQLNYTFGLKYTNFRDNSYTNVILSRSLFNNRTFKYAENDESSEENLLFDFNSFEKENKLRIENVSRFNGFKWLAGVGYEFDQYKTSSIQQIPINNQVQKFESDSTLNINQWSAFTQISKGFLDKRLNLSAGLRLDAADYSKETSNLFKQISPRLSASYNVNEQISINANWGLYHQLPSYTLLGYIEDNKYVNRDNGLGYSRCMHYVAGLELNTRSNTRYTLEGFFKNYSNYPFLLRDSISFANLGGDFGVVGNEPANSTSEGRTYGLEFLAQQKFFKGFFGILAYTLSWSEFKDKKGVYVPTSWDSRHILNLTAGYRFGKNWELGAKWRFTTGSPYTPYDVQNSALIDVWNATAGDGLLDYDRLNGERIPSIHSLDMRIDKKFFFDKWNFQLYMDIENVYGFAADLPDFLILDSDAEGNPQFLDADMNPYMANPNNPELQPVFYKLKFIGNGGGGGTPLPSIGIIAEF